MADAGTSAAPLGRTRPWLVAPTVGFAAFMEVLDISIANVALQHIAGALSASQNESTWVLTSYLVTNAMILPVSGWLSDTIGRKRLFVGCIAGFTLSSLLCGLAPDLSLLVAFRALQGLTGGGLQPTAEAILADAFPPEKRGMAFAVYGMAVVFGPAIGPTVGGWITDQFSWRWIFLINVPVGIVLQVAAYRFLPETPRRATIPGRVFRIDYLGFSLLAVGLGSLQLALDRGQEYDWFGSNLIITLMVCAAVTLTAFTIWELRQHTPIVDLRLLANRNFALGNMLMVLLGLVLLSTTVLLPFFVQSNLGYSAEDAGFVISAGGFTVLAMLPMVGALVSRVDARWLIAIGLITLAIALFHLSNLSLQSDYGWLVQARMLQAVGLSFLFIPVRTIAFAGISQQDYNNGSAILNVVRNLGGSFGIAVVTTILARRTQYHQSVLTEHLTTYDERYNQVVGGLQGQLTPHGGSAGEVLHKAQAVLYNLVQQQASTLAFVDVFWLLGLLCAVLVPGILLIRQVKLPGQAAREPETIRSAKAAE